jgi:MerR family copper efflux transcriptional regulator
VTKPATARALRSGELARLVGVSRDTLHYYEKRGLLLPPLRSAKNYRLYPEATVGRIRLIRGALAIGFSTEELARILRQRDRGCAPCHEVSELAGAKLAQLDRQIAELTALRATLARSLRAWKRRLGKANGSPARLLESFVAAYPESVAALSPLISPGLRQKLKNDKVRKK